VPSLAYRGFADQVGDRIVAGIKRVEVVVAYSTETWAGLAGRVPVPPRPARIAKADVAGKLPSMRAIAETNFGVVERVLDAQKRCALSVLSAATRTKSATAAPSVRAARRRSAPVAAKPSSRPARPAARPAKAAAKRDDS
jgi:hypothetical protein